MSDGGQGRGRCCLCFHTFPLDSLRSLIRDNANDSGQDRLLDKLRRFLGLRFADGDRRRRQQRGVNNVCLECVAQLDYCLGFVDRARRIETLLLDGAQDDDILADLEFRSGLLCSEPVFLNILC